MSKSFALSIKGGAVYGLGAIGVIRFLQEHDLKPRIVAGSSSGSIVATLYCLGLPWQEMMIELMKFNLMNFLSVKSLFKNGTFADAEKYRKALLSFKGDINFKDLQIPLLIFATNPKKAERVFIDKGSVIDAIVTSSGLPPIFPISYLKGFKNQALMDGDFTSGYSASHLKDMGVEKVLGISYKQKLRGGVKENIINRTLFMQKFYSYLLDKQSDLIDPPDIEIEFSIGHTGQFNLKDLPHIVHNGYMQSLRRKDEIFAALK